MYRSAFGGVKELQRTGFTDWSYFKHHVINYIIDMKAKFGGQVKDIIIAIDWKDTDGKYWRSDIHPEYKQQRKTSPSLIPKDILHKEFKELQDEIAENLPWKVIGVPGAEADDVIGALCEKFSSDCVVLFVTDKDYHQLQVNNNIKIFNITQRDITTCADPKYYKFFHIIKGDVADNIPTIYNDKSSTGRAKPIRDTLIKKMYETLCNDGPEEFRKQYLVDKNHEKNFIMNRRLVDLTLIPQEFKDKISLAYDSYIVKGNQKKAWNYFRMKKLRQLIEKVQML
jgi:5'-3' exonuclease